MKKKSKKSAISTEDRLLTIEARLQALIAETRSLAVDTAHKHPGSAIMPVGRPVASSLLSVSTGGRQAQFARSERARVWLLSSALSYKNHLGALERIIAEAKQFWWELTQFGQPTLPVLERCRELLLELVGGIESNFALCGNQAWDSRLKETGMSDRSFLQTVQWLCEALAGKIELDEECAHVLLTSLNDITFVPGGRPDFELFILEFQKVLPAYQKALDMCAQGFRANEYLEKDLEECMRSHKQAKFESLAFKFRGNRIDTKLWVSRLHRERARLDAMMSELESFLDFDKLRFDGPIIGLDDAQVIDNINFIAASGMLRLARNLMQRQASNEEQIRRFSERNPGVFEYSDVPQASAMLEEFFRQ